MQMLNINPDMCVAMLIPDYIDEGKPYHHCLLFSLSALVSAEIQTIDLGMMRQVYYHYATILDYSHTMT
jgi:hypothetical protein